MQAGLLILVLHSIACVTTLSLPQTLLDESEDGAALAKRSLDSAHLDNDILQQSAVADPAGLGGTAPVVVGAEDIGAHEGYGDPTDWSPCTRSCRTSRRRVCVDPDICGDGEIWQQAYCYVAGSNCEEVVSEAMQTIQQTADDQFIVDDGYTEQDELYVPNYDEAEYEDEYHEAETSGSGDNVSNANLVANSGETLNPDATFLDYDLQQSSSDDVGDYAYPFPGLDRDQIFDMYQNLQSEDYNNDPNYIPNYDEIDDELIVNHSNDSDYVQSTDDYESDPNYVPDYSELDNELPENDPFPSISIPDTDNSISASGDYDAQSDEYDDYVNDPNYVPDYSQLDENDINVTDDYHYQEDNNLDDTDDYESDPNYVPNYDELDEEEADDVEYEDNEEDNEDEDYDDYINDPNYVPDYDELENEDDYESDDEDEPSEDYDYGWSDYLATNHIGRNSRGRSHRHRFGKENSDTGNERPRHHHGREILEQGQCGISRRRNEGRRRHMNSMMKIIAGKESLKGMFPWQVALLNRRKSVFCGGTLIGTRWVMTAAHCVRRKMFVRLAEHDVFNQEGREIELKVQQTFKHPNYDSDIIDCDIALLKLPVLPPMHQKGGAVTEGYVDRACLPESSEERPPTKKRCVVSGWGTEAEGASSGSEVLKYATIPVVSQKVCEASYPDHPITENMFCAGHIKGGADTCSGDSGGPLMCSDTITDEDGEEQEVWTVFGVTSFGNGCGNRGIVGVYTKVVRFLDWMDNIMELNSK